MEINKNISTKKINPICYYSTHMFLLTLLLNRFFAKIIHVGYIYTIDIVILSLIFLRIKKMLLFIKNNILMFLLYISFFLFLIYDIINKGYTDLTLRKFAIFAYFIIPWLYFIYMDCLRVNSKYILLCLSILSPVIVIFRLPYFQSSMLSEVLAVLTIISFYHKKYFKFFPLVFSSFILVVSGKLADQYVYRTPLVVFIVTFFTAFISIYKNRLNNYRLIFTLFISLLMLYLGLFSGIIGDIFIGLSGLFKSRLLYNIGLYIGGSSISTRGDAAGTVGTRIFFWTSILLNSFKNFRIFLLGEGFSQGFLDVVAPSFNFKNKSLIEPHNSFIGIYFKTGILGLSLTIFYIRLIYLKLRKTINVNYIIPFFISALLYASMEVALENPHGAFTFWFLIFSPIIFFHTESRKK